MSDKKLVRLSVGIPIDYYNKLKIQGDSENLKIADIIRRAIQFFLKGGK